jgi:hypothetical protein
MRRLIRTLVLAFAAALSACDARGDATGIATDDFIDVIVELRRASENTLEDTAAFAVRRDRILAEAGVTVEDLQAYVEAHGRDVEHMARVWETINARLSQAAGEGEVQ